MKKTNLQDCLKCTIDNRGVTPHKRGTEWTNSGVPVYSANNVKTSGIQKKDEIRFVPENIYPLWMKQPLEKGDILLTSEAPAGEVYYWNSDEKIIVGQRLYGLKVKEDINSKYLKYYLQSPVGQKAIQSQQSGSTVFGISAKTFSSIEIMLPEKKVQDFIGEILYCIDSKIELNNRINDELESMAKTLYDYWFLQFEFPNEEGKPYKSSGGKMVWNEELKREIPEGWEVGALSEIVKITMGSSPKGTSLNKEKKGIIFYQGKTDFGNRFPVIRMYTTNPIKYAEQNDILLSVRAPVGNVNIANEKCCIGRGLAAINGKYMSFLYYLMLSNQFQFEKYNNGGTTFGAITKEELYALKITIPSEKIINKFNEKVCVIDKLIKKNAKEYQELESLRDFLLPLLMNGQVGFKENKND